MAMVTQLSLHFTSVRLVEDALRVAFGSGFDVRVQGPLRVGDRSEVVPDVTVVAGSPRDYRDDHPRTALLVVEVADTSLDYDRAQKASLYAKSKIPEYWIINLVDLRIEVFRRPSERTDALFGHGYLESNIHLNGASLEPLAANGATVTVADLLP